MWVAVNSKLLGISLARKTAGLSALSKILHADLASDFET